MTILHAIALTVAVHATIHMIRRNIKDGHYGLMFFPAIMAGLTTIAIGAAIYLQTAEGVSPAKIVSCGHEDGSGECSNCMPF